jgi:hypothetical protein
VDLFERLHAQLEASETFKRYSARERMLGYNFSFFDVAVSERSFIAATYQLGYLLADYRERFKILHTEWVQEGVAMDEIKERVVLASTYPDLLWALHRSLLAYWAADTSPQFAQTEKAIEIFSKVPLEFMGTNILDSAFDAALPDASTSSAPWRVFNIGHSTPVPLKEFISTMEQALGVKAVCEWLPAQPGDVPATHADTSALQAWVGYSPPTSLDEGVRRFTDWFRPRHRR